MESLRIANCSGFFGDRLDAAKEMVEGGPIDFLTGDYLAELTMLVLYKTRQAKSSEGYARTFLSQMEQVLGTCIDKGIKVVSNAGGLNPKGLAEQIEALASRLGVPVKVAYVEGDDLLSELPSLQAKGELLANMDTGMALSELGKEPVTANAYLGAWGIVEGLSSGADVVVCPRVTDASLVVGPAAWRFGWEREDYDAIAGAIVAGHIIECGAQATGGNFAFFKELPDHRLPGLPIAEMYQDGSCVITKHPGTGGMVTVDTVTAQLLYEITGPRYLNPDATALFDTIALSQEGKDRVRVQGCKGEPPPPTTKVAINYFGGYRNTMTFVLTGLDIEQKAQMALDMLRDRLGGTESFEDFQARLIRSDRPDAPSNELASAYLSVSVKDPDPKKVGRHFSDAVVDLVLSCYPGLYLTTPPTKEQAYGVYWPTLVPNEVLDHRVIIPSKEVRHIAPAKGVTPAPDHSEVSPASESPHRPESPSAQASASTGRVPIALGELFGARSGDKGGNANVGLWARDDASFAWLVSELTPQRFKELMPEAAPLEVRRFVLSNLRAINFVVVGLLGEGVASSLRQDAQAKSLGEYLRSRVVEVPEELVSQRSSRA